jgi:hypothetical protein
MTTTTFKQGYQRSSFKARPALIANRDELSPARGIGLALVMGIGLWAALVITLFV